MNFTEWLTSFGGIIISVLVSAVGVAWYLRGRIDHFERSLGEVLSATKGLTAAARTSNELFGIVFGSLQRAGGLSDQDVSTMVKALGEGLPAGIDNLIDKATARGNPFTVEEGERLKQYVAMIRQGAPFTSSQARDFYVLGNKLAQEEPQDPGVWPLVALGALLLGLYLGAAGQRRDRE